MVAEILPIEPLVQRGLDLCDRCAARMTNLIKSVEDNWKSKRAAKQERDPDADKKDGRRQRSRRKR
jgi:hypothetical protein